MDCGGKLIVVEIVIADNKVIRTDYVDLEYIFHLFMCILSNTSMRGGGGGLFCDNVSLNTCISVLRR